MRTRQQQRSYESIHLPGWEVSPTAQVRRHESIPEWRGPTARNRKIGAGCGCAGIESDEGLLGSDFPLLQHWTPTSC